MRHFFISRLLPRNCFLDQFCKICTPIVSYLQKKKMFIYTYRRYTIDHDCVGRSRIFSSFWDDHSKDYNLDRVTFVRSTRYRQKEHLWARQQSREQEENHLESWARQCNTFSWIVECPRQLRQKNASCQAKNETTKIGEPPFPKLIWKWPL